ncbi:MAG: Gfo/Idh/MocA family oxidoreductase [Synergistaceae bacterium]|jgi:predicted dehydrogenase|nr:Gfo/Idh/MocA family oxidoreductase [Synergistaceae bacterium]
MIEGRDLGAVGARLKYGLIGGGPGSFIAAVHRAGIDMTRSADLAAGCFSRDAAKNRAAGSNFGVADDRVYSSYAEMAEKESGRGDGVDFVVIATPNDTHYAMSKAFLEKGVNVSCDKPLCLTVEEALDLDRTARAKNALFMVTYVYTGYPLVRHARELVQKGALGDIRVIMAEYAQDWLADKIEDGKEVWRTDPKQSGVSCCVGDIGTHIENMVHFVTGLEIDRVSATLSTFVKGRALDDNALITVKYKGGAVGNYWPSQVAIGRENGLAFRIYGTEGALEWRQENPNEMRYVKKGNPPMILTRAGNDLGPAAARWTRMPAGHPEGLFAAWANIYEAFCDAIKNKAQGKPQDDLEIFPTAYDGARGVKFVHDCVKSSGLDSAWIDGSAPVL